MRRGPLKSRRPMPKEEDTDESDPGCDRLRQFADDSEALKPVEHSADGEEGRCQRDQQKMLYHMEGKQPLSGATERRQQHDQNGDHATGKGQSLRHCTHRGTATDAMVPNTMALR